MNKVSSCGYFVIRTYLRQVNRSLTVIKTDKEVVTALMWDVFLNKIAQIFFMDFSWHKGKILQISQHHNNLMIHAHYLSNVNCAIYKNFSKGFQISSNFSIKLHLCNIFMGLNPRWKYLRHVAMGFFLYPFICFVFTPLFRSQFSFITRIKPQRCIGLVADC